MQKLKIIFFIPNFNVLTQIQKDKMWTILIFGCLNFLTFSQSEKVKLEPGITFYMVYGTNFKNINSTDFHCSMLVTDPYCKCMSTLVTSLSRTRIGYEEYWLQPQETKTEQYRKALFDLILTGPGTGEFRYIDESAKLGAFKVTVELGFVADYFVLFTYPAKYFPGLETRPGETVGLLNSAWRIPDEEDVERAVKEMKKRGISLSKMRRIKHKDCPLNPINNDVEGSVDMEGFNGGPYGGI